MKKTLKINKTFFILAFLINLALSNTLSYPAHSREQLDINNYNNNLQIINGKNGQLTTSFQVKIADTRSDQEKGLMYIKELPKNMGLLFNFSQEKVLKMWMKNTLIYLDMLFIDKNGKIVKIAKSAKPLSKKLISSKVKAKMVLEINGGLSQELGIEVGDKIRFQ